MTETCNLVAFYTKIKKCSKSSPVVRLIYHSLCAFIDPLDVSTVCVSLNAHMEDQNETPQKRNIQKKDTLTTVY